MTSRATEIQTLIADVDNLLTNKGKLLPRVLVSQGQEPREVLERVRNFLLKIADEAELEQSRSSPLLSQFANNQHSITSVPQNEFTALIQPLHTELQGLLQERANLVQEIKQLEQRRLHNYSLAQQMANQEQMIEDFFRVLKSRLALSSRPETLTNQQLTIDTPSITEPPQVNVNPIEVQSPNQLESLTRLASELDQRLVALDGTVNVVFEGLQRNIHTYHESLSNALLRMHSKGVEGEQILSNLIDNLTTLQQQTASRQTVIPEVEQTFTPSASETNFKSEVTPVSSPVQIINTNQETTNDAQDTIPDLDAVLLELSHELEMSENDDTDVIVEPQTELETDEVDELYASLFGSDDVIPKSAIVNDTNVISQKPISVTQSTLESEELVDITQSPSPSETNVTDSWVEPSNIDVQSTEAEVQATDELSDLWNLFTQDQITEIPPSTDTVTLLTDLLPDDDIVGQVEEVEPTFELTDVSHAEASPKEVDRSDNYIPASPEESLLPVVEVRETSGQIYLDEEQLQQLDRDLSNFDGELIQSDVSEENINFLTSQTSNLEASVPAENPETIEASVPTENPETIEASVPTVNETDDNDDDLNIQQAVTAEPQSALNQDSSPIVPVVHTKDSNLDAVWYLGIDLGTTGISAALLNRSTTEVYPLYWSAHEQGETTLAKSLRLPAEVYLPTPVQKSEGESQTNPNLYSAQLKPYLQIAIPYKSDRHRPLSTASDTSEHTQKWEPVLQLNEFSTVPLVWIVRSLSKLFLTLKSDRTSTTPGLIALAVGIEPETFRNIINNIAGVICNCPSNWSEQYRFNIREALITSKLVEHPQQVFFVEEAIASLLSELDGANGEIVKLNTGNARPIRSEQPLLGNTLVINIGASATEMALVDLPENLQELAHSDFMLHGFTYAGKGIEQDIICQLLFPAKWREPRTNTQNEDKTITSNPWHWQPSIPGLDQMRWHSLGLEELDLPRAGEPDLVERTCLMQRLESSVLGQALLDAAIALRLILQHQESFTLELADQRWVLQRRDLESQVFVPFVRRLNRELNRLLVARGIPTEAINQAILTGGVASIGAVSRWLRQKLPNAKIIQDLYLGENGTPNCSRVAYGLTMLPLHPQVLEVPRQQYTDYFLFTELLRLLPERSVSFGEVIQLFEGRGINTRSCQQRLLAFLEGELPPGLIPNTTDTTWLTNSSKENSDYKAIAATPLFEKQGSLTYRPNNQQLQSLRRYLDAIKASTQQSLLEPYTVNFALEVTR